MGADKASLVHDGARLVDRVHDRLRGACDPILFAPGRAGRLGALPGPQLDDVRPGSGPLGGLVTGLAASPHELVAVVAVDLPWCSAALLWAAAEAWVDEDALVPVDDAGPQVLHAIYARKASATLQRYLDEGQSGVRDAMSRLDVRYLDEDFWRGFDPSGRFALNVNRPEDLALLDLGDQSLGDVDRLGQGG